MSKFKELFSYSSKQNKDLEKKLNKIKKIQESYSDINISDFKLETEKFKERLRNGETTEDIKLEVFALISECFKKIQQQEYPDRQGYYDEQIKASLVLANGDLAQMLTGEGKTYALTLATYLEALKGEGVHVVTSNEYLAERDLEDNKKLYDTLGLSSAFIADDEKKDIKRKLYKSDIIYTTPTTIAFDYLRDNMVINEEEKVMNGLASVILDEVDSSLIDEANNPYIISDKESLDLNMYKAVNEVVGELKVRIISEKFETKFQGQYIDEIDNVGKFDIFVSQSDNDYIITDLGLQKINSKLNKLGYGKREVKLDKETLYDEPMSYLSKYINNAVKVNYTMKKDEDYLVTDGKIEVINKKGGRVVKGSKFSNGINQALEAKENLEVSNENVVLNSINQPNLFKLYKNFAGLSGTLTPSEKEFKEIYKKDIVVLKPRKGMNRKDENTEIVETKADKDKLILEELRKCIETNRPVLLSTSSVLESNYISDLLNKNNIKHKLLNAKNPDEEASIIKDAGQLGSITVTTNIAGRGTDIKPSKETLEVGGIYVLSTTLSESKRIDDQLRGRSGRQGNVGKSKFIISLEDDIFRKNLSPKKIEVVIKLIREKQIDKLQKFITVFQGKLENNSFGQRKTSNDYHSVDSLIRENFDKEKDIIRSTKDIKGLLINMSSDDNKALLDATFTKEQTQEIKKQMLNICKDYWIDFINNAPIRKEQAMNNSSQLGTKPDDEYLRISFDEWKLYSDAITKEINNNVIRTIKIPEKNITLELDDNIKDSFKDITNGKHIEDMINNYNLIKDQLTAQKQDVYNNIINIQKERYGKVQIEVIDYINSEDALNSYVQKINLNVLTKEQIEIINERVEITRRTLQNPNPISKNI